MYPIAETSHDLAAVVDPVSVGVIAPGTSMVVKE
jgi:hypothetical protein